MFREFSDSPGVSLNSLSVISGHGVLSANVETVSDVYNVEILLPVMNIEIWGGRDGLRDGRLAWGCFCCSTRWLRLRDIR